MTAVSVTKEQIIAVAGEFADPALTSDQWALVVERVALEVNDEGWPSPARASMAARYLGAHFASKLKASMTPGAGGSIPAGPVASVTVGAVSKSYDTSGASMATWSQAAEELRSTAYGREYLRLVRLWAARTLVV